ncbi:MAG: penicillin-binding protein 2 [Sphingomonadales bacterium]
MKRRGAPLSTESSQGYTFTRRALVLGAAEAGVATLLAARMAWLSIAENERYNLLAESNRVQLVLIPPRRGWIVDRHGEPIAINRSDYRVDLIPDQLEHPEPTIAELAKLLQLPEEEVQRIREDLAKSAGYQPVPVAENLSFDKYAAVTLRLPELPGVAPLRGFSRFYPSGAAVGHLIGYVGAATKEEFQKEKNPLLITPGFKIGKDGLEKTMDLTLRGKPGAKRLEVTARGKLIRELSTLSDSSGNTLPLTIDAGLHEYAARRLGDQSGAVVVLDCLKGDILAMASMPAYDPNSFSDGISHSEWDMMAQDERHPLINKVLQGLYPSGSTIKPLMALALLQAGLDPEQKVNCTGAYRVGNAIFHCDKHHGPVAMADAIIKSCDIYFYHMSLQAGVDVISPMAKRMGFGEKFDLPVPMQRYGTVPDPEWMERKYHRKWEKYDTINMSIGQGNVLVNPLQLAVMAARIGSGTVVQPRLLLSQKVPQFGRLDVTPEHLNFVREAMGGVVNSGRGTASIAKLPVEGVLLGGKTGTAQVRRITMAERAGGVRSNESLAWKMRDHALFVCFAPFESPRYACGVIIEHGGWGASAAAPVARDTMTYLYDKQKALAALAPLEEGWGGTLVERMARRADEWRAQQAAQAARPPVAPAQSPAPQT